MPLLMCKDLAIGYEGEPVVSNLNFAVEAGDYLSIVGENGSGKSTLMKAILRLKSPMSGQIEVGDGLRIDEIGYMPQQTAAQKDFPASVREVVRSGCLNRVGMRPFYNRAEKHLAEENMRKLGIEALAKSCYRELSGGQQQRVLLARALCATRKILLLDEPTAGLDPNASSELYQLIGQLNLDGITIIKISHDIDASVKYSSHIMHIGKQTAMLFGTTEKYLSSDVGKFYVRQEVLV